MGIRFSCPNGHKLNVKEFLAGKRGICPECQAKFIIPQESGGSVVAIEESQTPSALESLKADDLAAPAEPLATDIWHVRTVGGAQHGPLTTSVLKAWIAEKKLDRDSWVWRAGWLDWQRASEVFPELGAVLGSTIPRPQPFVEESIIIRTDGSLPEEDSAVAAYRRRQRDRRSRMRIVSLLLGGIILLLTLALVVVLVRQ